MALVAARRLGSIPLGYWVMPSVILLTGLFVVLKPSESSELPLLVLGWCSILYGVVELVNALKIHSVRKNSEVREVREEASAEVAEAIEVTDDDAGTSDVGDDTLDVGSQDVDTGLVVAPRGDD